MNENPPLPQPSGATCPNCGAAQNAGVTYCTNCGVPLFPATKTGLSQTVKTVLSVVLSLAALGFGAFGSCFALLGALGGADKSLLGIGIGALIAAAACVWAIVSIQRRPKL